jgi:hypothetical protein
VFLLSGVAGICDALGQHGTDPNDELLVELHELHEVLEGAPSMPLNPGQDLVVEDVLTFLGCVLLGGIYTLVFEV